MHVGGGGVTRINKGSLNENLKIRKSLDEDRANETKMDLRPLIALSLTTIFFIARTKIEPPNNSFLPTRLALLKAKGKWERDK